VPFEMLMVLVPPWMPPMCESWPLSCPSVAAAGPGDSCGSSGPSFSMSSNVASSDGLTGTRLGSVPVGLCPSPAPAVARARLCAAAADGEAASGARRDCC
jgi:hypothetical protein